MATASSSRQQNQSRFSTLKVFKFASSSKPPPLPPKDPYHLYNPSLPSLNHSLSPDSASSQPQTPLSAQYATLMRSPSPSSSSYTPSRPTASPAPSSTVLSPETATPAGFRQGLRKLSSFGRRPKTPKTPDRNHADLQAPEPVEDPSISLPWNFQHNVHVDEHCNGLPPTWSTRLTEIGLSDEEISAIQARRTEARSRRAQSIYSLAVNRDAIPVNGNPPSVWRGLSGASSSQTSLSSVTSASRTPQRIVTRAISSTSDLPLGDADHRAQQRRVGPPPARPPPVPMQSEPTITSSSTPSFPYTKDTRPQTPPRRAYHIANSSLSSTSSPPPAYASPPKEAPVYKGKEGLSAFELQADSPSIPAIAVSMAASSSSPALASPPRLSLQKDSLGDLSSWSESLFSIIPATAVTPTPAPAPFPASTTTPPRTVFPKSPPTTATSPSNTAGRVATRSPVPTRLRGKSHSRSPSSQRNLPPQKPLPLHDLPARATLSPESTEGTPIPSAGSSPLWAEVMEMVRPTGEDGPSSSAGDSSQSRPTPPLTSTTASSSPYMRTPEHDMLQKDTLQIPLTPTGFSDEGMSDSGHTYESEDGALQVRSRDKENRDSDLSTVTVVPATIVSASIVRSARGNYVTSPVKGSREGQSTPVATTPTDTAEDEPSRRSPSPVSLVSSSESSASTTAFGSGSASGSAYAKSSPAPSPRVATFASADQGLEKPDGRKSKLPSLDLGLDTDIDLKALRRPTILIDDIMATGALSEATFAQSLAHPSPATPAPRYPGWVTEVVAPLSGFIDEALDPRTLFGDLREIGEGESGSVYAARLLTPSGSQRSDDAHSSDVEFVAIKNVPLVPNGSPKLVDLQRELSLMRRVRHQNVLSMEGVFVDIVEDALWIRMELMERSLADVLLLVDEGIVIEEKPIALLVSDVLHGLSYLQRLGIAHRDLRSDNLLVNSTGIAKIADFSSAVRVSKEEPSRSDNVGVIYWQAPEVRTPPYNALKVDVWSLGATVWEMAQAEPPFSDIDDPRLIPHRWPSLHQAEIYSRSFHDFLHLCSQPSSLRPDPNELLKTPFIRNASGRPTILKILSECRAIEDRASRRHSSGSNGTVSVS